MGRVHILILTASIGAGHTRAAEAIHAAIAARAGENVRISVVDFMARDVSVIHYLMKRVYLMMLRFVPNLYDVFFRFAGSAAGGGVVRSAFAWVMVRTMGRLIRSYRPDLVVATHPFPEGAAALWRARYGGDFLLAALLTDYALHRIWLSRGVDTYFVATEAMAAQMAELGIDRSLVHVTGIPIARAERHVNRAAAKERAGVPFELPALLLMGGGLGLGDIERTLCALETSQERLAVLVVAGHNAALAADARRAARTSRHLIRVWDYTDEVPLLMRAADLLITNRGHSRSARRLQRGCRSCCMIRSRDLRRRMRSTRHGGALQYGCIRASRSYPPSRRFSQIDCLQCAKQRTHRHEKRRRTARRRY